jgi:hypothetical protein
MLSLSISTSSTWFVTSEIEYIDVDIHGQSSELKSEAEVKPCGKVAEAMLSCEPTMFAVYSARHKLRSKDVECLLKF